MHTFQLFFRIISIVRVTVIFTLSFLVISCGSSSSSGSGETTTLMPSVGYWNGKATINFSENKDIHAGVFKSEGEYYLAIMDEASTIRSSLSLLNLRGSELSSSACSSQSEDMASCSVKTALASSNNMIGTYTYTLIGGTQKIVQLNISKKNDTVNNMSLPVQKSVFVDVQNETTMSITKDSSFSITFGGEIFESTAIKISDNILQITEAKVDSNSSTEVDFFMASLDHLSGDSSKLIFISLFNIGNLSKHGEAAGWDFNIATNTIVAAYNAGKKWYEDGIVSVAGSRNCSSCHGITGGGGSGPALKGNSKAQSDLAINAILTGPGSMAAFSNQSNKVISELATYLRHAWGNSPTAATNYVATESEVQDKRAP